MPRQDLLERLSPDDPNYKLGKRFYLEAWADSHKLVADSLAGLVPFSDWVDACIRTFDQGARAHVEFEDGTAIPTRCAKLATFEKKFIAVFTKELKRHSRRLGRSAVASAIEHLSRNVREIAARSKEQILRNELDKEAANLETVPHLPSAERVRIRERRAICRATP